MRELTEQDLIAVIGVKCQGFSIEQARIKGGRFIDSDHYGIALGKNEKGCFVTWQFHLNDNEEADFYWGHYWRENKEKALEDYRIRD